MLTILNASFERLVRIFVFLEEGEASNVEIAQSHLVDGSGLSFIGTLVTPGLLKCRNTQLHVLKCLVRNSF